jgi:hypothetical protein
VLPRRWQRRVGECGCAAPGPRQQLPRAVAGRSPPPSCLRVFLPPDCSAHQTPRSTGGGSRSMLSCSRWLLRRAGADLGPASLAVELTAGSVSASYFVKIKVWRATRHAAGSHRLTTPQCYWYIDPDSHARFLSPFRLVIPALVFLSRSVRPGSHGGGRATPPTGRAAFVHLPVCTTSSTAYFRSATTTTTITAPFYYVLCCG